MKKQGQEEISIPQAFMLLVGVGCLAWFLYLPGETVEKWNQLATYTNTKQKEILFSVSLVCLNLSLIALVFASVTGIGRLGQKIHGYYLKKNKHKSMRAFFLLWLPLTFVAYLLFEGIGIELPLKPVPEVIPAWQSTFIFKVIKFSGASLVSMILAGVSVGIKSATQNQSSKNIPALPTEKNKLVLGTINER